MAMSAETKPKTRENIRPPQSGSPQRAIYATQATGSQRLLCDRFLAVRRRIAMLRQIGVGGNALEARFEKTICLHASRRSSPPAKAPTRPTSKPRRFAQLKGTLKVGTQAGGRPPNSGTAMKRPALGP